MQLGRLWRTVKHLRPVQVWGRAHLRLIRPRPDLRPAPPRRAWPGHWVPPSAHGGLRLGENWFRFLNVERELDFPAGWSQSDVSRLWQYNLHYFEYLAAPPGQVDSACQESLIARWIADNPPGVGVGWEPFPTSLRIGHWIGWEAGGGELPSGALDSLAVQLRWLARRLEYHLLGNHLLANAWALALGGLFFTGPEADDWLARAAGIYAEQLPEQILPDGGHYERSPMYHSAVLEQLLDVLNAIAACGDHLPSRAEPLREQLRETIPPMQAWLAAMTHPDGEIALMNDAAHGIVPSPGQLNDYAARQGLAPAAVPKAAVTHLKSSGYVRLAQGPAVAILDLAPLGPDFLPGHAHADTLTFELSLYGQRLVVNSGTSTYDEGPNREWERSTAAHNTVEVAGQSSSEMWSSFRVGRRARATAVRVEAQNGQAEVEGWHDGYGHLGIDAVLRTWRMNANRLEIADSLLPSPRGPRSAEGLRAVSRFYLAPEVSGPPPGSEATELTFGHVGHTVRFGRDRLPLTVTASQYRPEFGVNIPNRCIEAPLVDDGSSEGYQAAVVTIEWQ